MRVAQFGSALPVEGEVEGSNPSAHTVSVKLTLIAL